MKGTREARLDEETQVTLDALTQRLGWSPTEVVREGLRLLAREAGLTSERKKIIGLGEFEGPPDLATSRKYLEDYGR